jgi:hypothetical protein
LQPVDISFQIFELFHNAEQFTLVEDLSATNILTISDGRLVGKNDMPTNWDGGLHHSNVGYNDGIVTP